MTIMLSIFPDTARINEALVSSTSNDNKKIDDTDGDDHQTANSNINKKRNILSRFLTNRTKRTVEDCSTCSASSTTYPSSSLSCPTKSVRFNESVHVRRILSRKSYTKDEIHSCWYDDTEYHSIKSSCYKVIRIAESVGLERFHSSRQRQTIRGLESQLTIGYQSRYQNRQDGVNAVLLVQSSTKDDVSIATEYSDISSSCQLWAHLNGIRDQKEAELCYDD
jgi:hypothetical protein